MTGTIAVPRETLERWHKQAARWSTRFTIQDEIEALLAQPEPVVDGFCGPEPPIVTTTVPHKWQGGMLRVDGTVIYSGTHNLPATCGDALRLATTVVNLHEGDDHLARKDVEAAILAHKAEDHKQETQGDFRESASSRWHRWMGTEWSPLVTRAEAEQMIDAHAQECHPQAPNCLNWSIGEGWCVHGLKPCSVGCSFKVPRVVT